MCVCCKLELDCIEDSYTAVIPLLAACSNCTVCNTVISSGSLPLQYRIAYSMNVLVLVLSQCPMNWLTDHTATGEWWLLCCGSCTLCIQLRTDIRRLMTLCLSAVMDSTVCPCRRAVARSIHFVGGKPCFSMRYAALLVVSISRARNGETTDIREWLDIILEMGTKITQNH